MEMFHNVHCTNCGKIVPADRMAVNVDYLIRDYLNAAVDRMGKKELELCRNGWRALRIGMHLTKFEMAKTKLLSGNDILTIHAEDILQFVEKKYRVRLRASGEENPAPDWDKLTYSMQLYNEKDADLEQKKNLIRRLLEYLMKNPEQTLAELQCRFQVTTDDQGQDYITQLQTSPVAEIEGGIRQYQHMVCPCCGEPFFIRAGEYEEKVNVMLGSSRVGKTAYLAALLDKVDTQLRNAVTDKSRAISISYASGEHFENFQNTIMRSYREGRRISKTDESKSSVPLLSLKVQAGQKTVILTLVDMPGEVFVPRDRNELASGEADGSFLINHRRICYSADAFWFCIDPVQIDERIRHVNTERDDSDKVEQRIDRVLTNVQNMLYIMEADSRKKEIPVAVMITKSDQLAVRGPLFPEGITVRDYHLYDPVNSPLCVTPEGYFNADLFRSIANNVKDYLCDENVDSIVSSIDKMFACKNYFSVAAYGRNADNNPNTKAPYGIALPFLWTLACMGYIKPICQETRMIRTGIFRQEPSLIWTDAPTEILYS